MDYEKSINLSRMEKERLRIIYRIIILLPICSYFFGIIVM